MKTSKLTNVSDPLQVTGGGVGSRQPVTFNINVETNVYINFPVSYLFYK